MLFLLTITSLYLINNGVIGVEFNESLLINQHHENFREISSVLRKVNDTLDCLQGLGKLVGTNEDLEQSRHTSPSILRNAVGKPLFVEGENAMKTSSVLRNSPELFQTSRETIEPYPLSKSLVRNRQSISPIRVSAPVDRSTTSSFVLSENTARGSKSVLRGEDHELKWHSVRGAVSDPASEFHMRTVQDYYKLLEDYGEGYLVIFLMELTRLVAEKDVADVHIILRHAESILNQMLKSGQLGWLGFPLTHVLLKFGVFISDGPIAQTRKYSEMAFNMIRFRNSSLHGDVNSIIDYADMLYEDDEGRQLFEALQEFEAYPNVAKTSKEVCQSLANSFFSPYQRLAESNTRQILLDAITYVLKTRFPKKSNDKNTKNDYQKTREDHKDGKSQPLSPANYLQIGTLRFRSANNGKDQKTEKTKNSFDDKTKNKVNRSVNKEQKQLFLKQAKAHLAKSKLFRRSENDLKVKQKILKDIVEGSSYSDEEAALQKNLNEALLRSNSDKYHRNVRSTTS